MPILIDDMIEPDRPVTRRELREELEWLVKNVATKNDLKAYATKDDLAALRQELKHGMATMRHELRTELVVMRDELRTDFRGELVAMRDELRTDFRGELAATRDELRTHFSVTTEAFKEQFSNLYDWSLTNVNGLSNRVDTIEAGQGGRIVSLETRVTRLEHRPKS
jgi:DNA anti-recombination protein RmuC